MCARNETESSRMSISNYQSYLVLNQEIATSGIFPFRDDPSGTASQTMAFVRTYAFDMSGGASGDANGGHISISQNSALFTLLGTEFGGDGRTNFRLPDLAGRIIVGSDYDIGAVYGSGQIETHQTYLPGTWGGAGLQQTNEQPSLAIMSLIQVGHGETPIGTIRQFGGNFEPAGYMVADGRELSIAQYPELFSKLGTAYGGNGVTTFRIPDLRGNAIVGVSDGGRIGEVVGQDTLTIADSQMPSADGGGGQPVDNRQSSVVMDFLISTAGIYPSGNLSGEFTYIGEVIASAATAAPPANWLPAHGQLLSIREYSVLFSVIGTTYGGDGVQTFALPDLRGRVVVGSGSSDDLGTLTVGETGGSNRVTLTDDDIPQLFINGTSGADTRHGAGKNDLINGNDGNDTLSGHGGNDQMNGGTGTNTMTGGSGADLFTVGAGNDTITDFAIGQDRLQGSVFNGIVTVDDLLALVDKSNHQDMVFTFANGSTLTLTGVDWEDFRLSDINLAPAITSGDGASTASYDIAENASNVIVPFAAVDANGDRITYTLSGADQTRFSINQTTGELTLLGTPDFEAPTDVDRNNTYEVVVTVTDAGGLTDSQAITVRVTDTNEKPTLSATALDPTFTENGAPVDLFSSVNVGTVESGQTIRELTLTVSGVTDGASETLMIDGMQVSLRDGAAGTTTGSASVNYTVAVTNGLATVTITDATGLSAAETRTLVDGLAYGNASDNPGNTDRVVTLTSIRDSGGTANAGVDKTDLSLAATVHVAPVNDAPDGADKVITLREDATHTFSAADFGFNDAADGNGFLALKVTTLPGSGTLLLGDTTGGSAAPTAVLPGAVIPSGSLQFLMWQPADDANGTGLASFTFQVMDNGDATGGLNTDSNPNRITFDVTPVNDSPEGADKTITLTEDSTYTFVKADFGFSDALDGDGFLALKITTLPLSGRLLLADPTGGSAAPTEVRAGDEVPEALLPFLMWQPDGNANGSGLASFTFQVIDDGDASSGLNVDPTPNRITFDVTPVNDAPSFTAGGNQTAAEDAGALTVAGWASAISAGPADEAGQVLSFTVSNNNVALFAEQPRIAADGTLTYKLADNANGVATVSVVLSDNGGTAGGGKDQTSPITFTITATAVNDAPSFTAGGNQTVLEDAGAQTVAGWASAISAGPADEASQVLSFSVRNDNAALFAEQPTIAADGTLTYKLADNANGVATVSVVLSDTGGTAGGGKDQTSPITFTITATAVNDAPSFTAGGDQMVHEDAGAQTVVGWASAISAGGADEAGQALSFSVSNNNSGLFEEQPRIAADGTLTYKLAENANGVATVSVILSDDGGTAGGGKDYTSPITFTITATAVNDAPSFTAGGDQTVSEDAGAQTVTGWASAISAGPGNETGQVLSFAVSNDNAALFAEQPTIAVDGTLTYKFADNANGVATVRVVLSDTGGTAGGGKDSADPITFTLTATPVNDAPTDIGFKPMATTGGGLPSVMENSGGAVIASVVVADIDDTTFTYTLDDSRFEIVGDQLKLKAGASLDYEAAQSVTVKVTATDSGRQQVTRDITIAVTDDGRDNNSAPFISSANADTTVQSGTPLSLLIGDGHFTDPQGTDLDYQILVDGVAKPDWLSFDAETGLLSGTPTSAEAGSYVITVSATDGGLSSPSDEFILVVTNPTAPPDPKGTRGKDKLEGSDFDNIMDGRRGNDQLTGNGGADTFVFGKNYGRDVILDFHPEEGDRIDLSGAVGIRGFQDLMKNHVFDSGDNIRIRADDGSVLVVQGIDPGELTKDMFLF